jgi:acetylornithine deacetylase/succinyl-diaminopimelate desuccinylase-like protein
LTVASGTRVLEFARNLIRLDTTNPPGKELAAAEYVAGRAREGGLGAEVIETAPERGCVAVTLPGKNPDPPLLLVSHLDVVAADPQGWTHPPFAGAVADGALWGRGAVDTKNTVAAHLAALLDLARAGWKPGRGVVMLSVADEEVGGQAGMAWIARHRKDLIRAEYAIGEGGGVRMDVAGRRFWTVQTAEKGTISLRLTARGSGGHGSVPTDDNPVLRLSAALARFTPLAFPVHITPSVRAFLDGVARGQPKPVSEAFKRYRETGRGDLPVSAPVRRMLDAMIRDTATPTVVRAGDKVNVIPGEAQGRLDGRVLPSPDIGEYLSWVRALAGPDVEVEVVRSSLPLEAPLDSPVMEALGQIVRELDPGAAGLLPVLDTGATDAKHIPQVKVYGFSPMSLEAFDRQHGTDERIDLADLDLEVEAALRLVRLLCG